MDTINYRNGKDLTEAEIRRGGRNTQKNYTQKDLMNRISKVMLKILQARLQQYMN